MSEPISPHNSKERRVERETQDRLMLSALVHYGEKIKEHHDVTIPKEFPEGWMVEKSVAEDDNIRAHTIAFLDTGTEAGLRIFCQAHFSPYQHIRWYVKAFNNGSHPHLPVSIYSGKDYSVPGGLQLIPRLPDLKGAVDLIYYDFCEEIGPAEHDFTLPQDLLQKPREQ